MNKLASLLLSSLLSLLVLAPAARAGEGSPWIGLVLERGDKGARVREVVDGAPGQKAGVKVGDEVVGFDSDKIATVTGLIDAVKRAGVGRTVKLTVLGEGGKTRTVSIKLEPKPELNVVQRDSLVGKAAPDFTPAVQSGEKLGAISSMKGQVVLIDFFATWCGPCVAMMPHIESLHEKLAGKGLRVIGVSTETAQVVAEAAGRFGLKYTLASDESEGVSSRYRVFALPTMVLIDRQGVVREVSVADPDAIDAAIAKAMK